MIRSFQLGLRGKILIPTLTVVGISMCIAILSSYISSKRALETSITDQIVQVCKSTSDHLESWVSRTQRDMITLSHQKAIRSLLITTKDREAVRSETNTHLKNIMDEFSFYEMLLMVDASGNVIASAQPSVIGKFNVRDREYFQKSIKGKPFISDILKSKLSGNPVFVISAPVSDKQGVAGILMGVVDLNYFSKKFMREINIAGGYAYIYNQKGIIVSHPSKKLVLELDMNTLDFGKEMIRMKEGILTYTWEEVEKLVAFRSLKAANWTLAITANNDNAFAAVKDMLWLNLAILIVSILLISLILIIMVSRILLPVAVIEKGIRGVIKGDMSRRIEVKSKDEMGKIAAVINHLLDSFQTAIGNVVVVMNGVAHGDLTQKVEGDYEGEIKNLQNGIDQSLSLLSKTIIQVGSVTDQVNTGADQISSASQSLASGTTEQAASLEEISSSMSEVESRSHANNDSATQAAQLTTQTMEIANRGNDQMREMLSSMDIINSSSSEISKIIKVIDEIAFQTNLLALNAAVEAARAGKYGKGFAVVAEEVRNLAARSAEAAKNTTELIENSIKEVDSGVSKAGKTSDILTEISDSITKANDLVGEIAASSQEQSNSTSEINKSLVQVNQIVQQNASISEETASASEELSGQAMELQGLMGRFKLNQTATTTSMQQPAPIQQEIPAQKAGGSLKMITLDDDNFGKY